MILFSCNNQKKVKVILCGLLLLALYWLYGTREIAAEPWQWADDGLYLRQAEGIIGWINGVRHQWLGIHDAVLLSKTPLFPVFLALTKVFCIPLRMGEFLLFLIVPFLFRRAMSPFVNITFFDFCIVTIILVGLPVMPLEVSLTRTALQMFLASVCLIGMIGFLIRVNEDSETQSLWALIFGLGFSLAYLNREESLWLAPVVGLSMVIWFFYNYTKIRSITVCLPIIFLLLAIIGPIFIVSLLNYESYGVFFTTVRRAPQMTRVYKILSSLEPATRERYVPIRTETRYQAYKISPAFASLSTYLEGPSSDSIACSEAHHILNDKKGGAREFFASTFEFSLRDAVYASGATNAVEMEKKFKQIADELALGIKQNKIKSGSCSIGICTPPMKGDTWKVLQAMGLSLYNLYSLMGMEPQLASYSSGEQKDLYRMAWMTQNALAPTHDSKEIMELTPLRGLKTTVLKGLNIFDELFYDISLIALLVGIFFFVKCKMNKKIGGIAVFIAILLLGALLIYAFIMALLDTFGFPILKYGRSYNAYGFSPLAVLSVYSYCFFKALSEKFI